MCTILLRFYLQIYILLVTEKLFVANYGTIFIFVGLIKFVPLSAADLLICLKCIYCRLIHSSLLVPLLECFLPFVISELALVVTFGSIISLLFILQWYHIVCFEKTKCGCSDAVFYILAAHFYTFPDDLYSNVQIW